jgi:hypothetical protein
MGYRMMARVHAAAMWARDRSAGGRADGAGQGTVEYVGLILLVAVVLAGVVAATKSSSIGTGQIGATILKKLKSALDSVN